MYLHLWFTLLLYAMCFETQISAQTSSSLVNFLKENTILDLKNLFKGVRNRTDQCFGLGSGSGWIRIILPNPDRDKHPGSADPDPVSKQCRSTTLVRSNLSSVVDPDPHN
jgi:hypothetical protein